MKTQDTEGLTTRSLEAEGYMLGKVETKLTRTITKDLWGFVDLIAVSPIGGLLLLQVTTSSHLADRVKKILARPEALELLKRKAAIQAWGWRPDGVRCRIISFQVREGEIFTVEMAI